MRAVHVAAGSVGDSSLMNKGHRVHVQVDRGVLISDIASITEDLPVDCSQRTIIFGSGIFRRCRPRPSSRLMVVIMSLT